MGHNTKDDVFIGLRDRMKHVKLSLHPAKWRVAYTEEAGPEYVEEGEDRLIQRFEKPEEVSPGWRHGCTVVIANSNLSSEPFREKKIKNGALAFFPAPADPWSLRFDLYIGQADAQGAVTFDNSIGVVGLMRLRSGLQVGIIAHEVPVDDEYEARLAELRRQASDGIDAEGQSRGWAVGWAHEDGAPILVDLSHLGP